MKTWPVFVSLQNAIAYEAGLSNPGPCAPVPGGIIADYVKRIQDYRLIGRSLLIGPGGPAEVTAMRNILGGTIHALTAHAPELEAIRNAGLNDVVAELGDMHEMPYENAVFDFVFASNVLEHALAPYIALLEIRRVLRDGGIANLIIPDFGGYEGGVGPFHLHCLDERVWRELLRKVGMPPADVMRQEAGESSAACACYWHFRCAAGAPPAPHDRILNELRACRG